MIELIRGLDRPLDQRHARAVVGVASCLALGFAALVGFGVISGSRPTINDAQGGSVGRVIPTAPQSPPASDDLTAPTIARATPQLARTTLQDPQDHRGSLAYRRALRTLREDRALQHLPFHRGRLSITLIGANRGRAVVRIAAATASAARRGWHGFLRRYSDDGAAYVTRLTTAPAREGSGRRRREESRGWLGRRGNRP